MLSHADLLVYQGDDYRAIVEVTDGGATAPDQILSGYTALAQIRNGPADSSPAVVATIGTAVQSPYVNLSIPHAQTLALTGKLVWDLQLTAPDGTITTVLAGAVFTTLEVSR